MKHAQATEVNVLVKRRIENVILTIEDNGRGFAPDEQSPLPSRSGFGLTGMGERARLLGGELKVRSTKGRGTTVLFEIPLGQKHSG
jgi:signal transduction histidine kinase